jgi:hypothetical protein
MPKATTKMLDGGKTRIDEIDVGDGAVFSYITEFEDGEGEAAGHQGGAANGTLAQPPPAMTSQEALDAYKRRLQELIASNPPEELEDDDAGVGVRRAPGAYALEADTADVDDAVGSSVRANRQPVVVSPKKPVAAAAPAVPATAAPSASAGEGSGKGGSAKVRFAEDVSVTEIERIGQVSIREVREREQAAAGPFASVFKKSRIAPAFRGGAAGRASAVADSFGDTGIYEHDGDEMSGTDRERVVFARPPSLAQSHPPPHATSSSSSMPDRPERPVAVNQRTEAFSSTVVERAWNPPRAAHTQASGEASHSTVEVKEEVKPMSRFKAARSGRAGM